MTITINTFIPPTLPYSHITHIPLTQPSINCSQRTTPSPHQSNNTKRVLFIPDRIHQQPPQLPSWYEWLKKVLPPSTVLLQSVKHMPNPYESNSKRWEAIWLDIISQAINDNMNVSLIAQGSGADACLRFLESNSIPGAVILILPTSDEYYAGERHGRPYHWSLISNNVKAGRIALVTSTVAASQEENESLVNALQPGRSVCLQRHLGRYLEQTTAEDLLELISWAINDVSVASVRNDECEVTR